LSDEIGEWDVRQMQARCAASSLCYLAWTCSSLLIAFTTHDAWSNATLAGLADSTHHHVCHAATINVFNDRHAFSSTTLTIRFEQFDRRWDLAGERLRHYIAPASPRPGDRYPLCSIYTSLVAAIRTVPVA
jgi:hypothetical protein